MKALATADSALGRFRGSPMTPLLLFRSAEAAAGLDQLNEARVRFLKVADEHPDDPWAADALLRTAELTLKANDPETARALAARFAERYPENPHKANARLIEGQAALNAGQPDEAVHLLEPLLSATGPVDPDQAENTDTARLGQSVRLVLGMAYRAAGQAEKAAEVLQDITMNAAAGGLPDAQYILGLNHYEAGRFEDAIPALTAYLQARPDGDVAPDALAMLAIAHQELGNPDEAVKAIDTLAASFPQSRTLAPTRLRLGEAALDAGHADRAVALLRPAADGLDDPSMKAHRPSPASAGPARHRGAGRGRRRLRRPSGGHPPGPLAPDAALARAWRWRRPTTPTAPLDAYDRALNDYGESARAPEIRLARARLLDRLGTAASQAGEPDQAVLRFTQAADAYKTYLKNPNPNPGNSNTRDAVLAEWAWALRGAGKGSWPTPRSGRSSTNSTTVPLPPTPV